MYVIVSMQQVYGPFSSEDAAIKYAKKYSYGVKWIVRPIVEVRG